MMINIFSYLWYVLLIIPAFFWFFLVREFNKKEKTRFPSFLYAIFYLIPGVHYLISWSFIKDVRENQIKAEVKNPLPIFKTSFLKLILPQLFLVVGMQVFALLGIMAMLFVPILGELITQFSIIVPLVSFVWLVFGFRSVSKTIQAL